MHQIILLLSLITCCGVNKRDEASVIPPKIVSFSIDNDDSSKFGYIELENGIAIGVTSLCIVDDLIYFTDEFHKNVKCYNISESSLSYSDKVTKATFFKQFNDIIEFDNKLYITSSESNVYVLSKDLKGTSTFKLPTKGGYPIGIASKSDSTLDFFISVRDSLYRINKENEIILSRKLTSNEVISSISYFDLEKGNARYKKINYYKKGTNEYIEINGKEVKLIEPFKYSSDSFNVDYNNNNLVIFSINDKELKLYIYQLK